MSWLFPSPLFTSGNINLEHASAAGADITEALRSGSAGTLVIYVRSVVNMSLLCYLWKMDKLGLRKKRFEPKLELRKEKSQTWLKLAKELITYANNGLSYKPEMIYYEESEEKEDEKWEKLSHSRFQCNVIIIGIIFHIS
ncbi:hypothetical protein CHS0354_026032 [Potamilus streckersoni]|uniref:Uncharacterized protein n=1 Tax=Potamilus streckersoni TaxID=2493646 RepID=A0AAE0SBX2_9BIVA|nr:hypothetical protein CHS0354_026032 [Potamilus streckersoni]